MKLKRLGDTSDRESSNPPKELLKSADVVSNRTSTKGEPHENRKDK